MQAIVQVKIYFNNLPNVLNLFIKGVLKGGMFSFIGKLNKSPILSFVVSILNYSSLAGVSRSATIIIAYLMTVTDLPWTEAMNAVRGARKQSNPNFGFQRQLQNYEHTRVKTVSLFLY